MQSSFMIGEVRIFVVSILIALQFGCTTPEVDHYNRRDLYDPEAVPTLHHAPTPEPKPQFRG